MPAELERCVADLKAKGHSDSSAWAICKSSTGLSEKELEEKSNDALEAQAILNAEPDKEFIEKYFGDKEKTDEEENKK